MAQLADLVTELHSILDDERTLLSQAKWQEYAELLERKREKLAVLADWDNELDSLERERLIQNQRNQLQALKEKNMTNQALADRLHQAAAKMVEGITQTTSTYSSNARSGVEGAMRSGVNRRA